MYVYIICMFALVCICTYVQMYDPKSEATIARSVESCALGLFWIPPGADFCKRPYFLAQVPPHAPQLPDLCAAFGQKPGAQQGARRAGCSCGRISRPEGSKTVSRLDPGDLGGAAAMACRLRDMAVPKLSAQASTRLGAVDATVDYFWSWAKWSRPQSLFLQLLCHGFLGCRRGSEVHDSEARAAGGTIGIHPT